MLPSPATGPASRGSQRLGSMKLEENNEGDEEGIATGAIVEADMGVWKRKREGSDKLGVEQGE